MRNGDGIKMATALCLLVVMGYAISAVIFYEERIVVQIIMTWVFGFLLYRMSTASIEED